MVDLLNLELDVFRLFLIFSPQLYSGFIGLDGFVVDRKHSDNVTSRKFM
jgi:hypothetical protein